SVVWRHRHIDEKAAQMSSNIDMRGFEEFDHGNNSYALGIYRDPQNSTEEADTTSFLICAWGIKEWGENHGESPFNYFIRTSVLYVGFIYVLFELLASDNIVFVFKPYFIHYYSLYYRKLHGIEITPNVSNNITPLDIPLNIIFYGAPGTGKSFKVNQLTL